MIHSRTLAQLALFHMMFILWARMDINLVLVWGIMPLLAVLIAAFKLNLIDDRATVTTRFGPTLIAAFYLIAFGAIANLSFLVGVHSQLLQAAAFISFIVGVLLLPVLLIVVALEAHVLFLVAVARARIARRAEDRFAQARAQQSGQVECFACSNEVPIAETVSHTCHKDQAICRECIRGCMEARATTEVGQRMLRCCGLSDTLAPNGQQRLPCQVSFTVQELIAAEVPQDIVDQTQQPYVVAVAPVAAPVGQTANTSAALSAAPAIRTQPCSECGIHCDKGEGQCNVVTHPNCPGSNGDSVSFCFLCGLRLTKGGGFNVEGMEFHRPDIYHFTTHQMSFGECRGVNARAADAPLAARQVFSAVMALSFWVLSIACTVLYVRQSRT